MGDLTGGGLGFGLADGDSLIAEGSRAERRYEQNGKECGQRRKDVSGSRRVGEGAGGASGVIHRLGWACSEQPEPYEPSRVGQRETLQLQEREKAQLRWKNKERESSV